MEQVMTHWTLDLLLIFVGVSLLAAVGAAFGMVSWRQLLEMFWLVGRIFGGTFGAFLVLWGVCSLLDRGRRL
jgi:hypothetical protein